MHLLNKEIWFSFLFFQFYKTINGQTCQSEELVNIQGKPLGLYKNKWYAIKNKFSGNYINSHKVDNGDILQYSTTETTFDLWNRTQWFRFNSMERFGWYSYLGFNVSKYDGYYYMFDYFSSENSAFAKQYYLFENFLIKRLSVDGYSSTMPDNDWFLWKFIPFEVALANDYNLNAIITNFELTQPMEEVINNNRRQVSLMQTSIITNNSPGELSEVVANQVTKSESQTISFSKLLTNANTYLTSTKVSVTAGFKLFGASLSTTIEADFDYTREDSTSSTEGSEQTLTKDVTYSISKTVNVLPYETVKVSSYVNWIDNLELDYTADIIITLNLKCGQFLRYNQTQFILDMIGFDEKSVNNTQYFLVFPTSGILTASMGLDSAFTVTSVDHECECTNTKQTPNLVYNSTNIKSKYSEFKKKAVKH